MVLMVERNRGEHLIHRFVGRGNEPDPHDVKITSLKQRIQELEFPLLQQDLPVEETEIKSNETESEPIWDIGDEEEEYPFVNKYPYFQEERIVLVEEESYLVYDTDNEEEESMPVYDTDIEDIIEEEGFVGKGGFGGEEDNVEDVVVVANDLCSLMIQTILSVDFMEDINTKSHELMSFKKSIIIKMLTKFSSGAYRKRAFNCKSKFVTEREEAGRCNFSVKPLKSKRRGSEKNGRYAAIMLSESRIKVSAESKRQQPATSGMMLFSIIKILLKMGQNGYNGHDISKLAASLLAAVCRVHEVHDEKRVWFEVELQGAQGDREAEVFRLVTMILQWLKDGWRTSSLKKRQTRTAW
ncbi:hypothetical protein Tco_0723660 [Tanacetum coccineum]